MTLQASYGSNHEDLIAKYNLKFAKVFASKQLADEAGLPIDVDDTLAMSGTQSFALIDNFARPEKSKPQGLFTDNILNQRKRRN